MYSSLRETPKDLEPQYCQFPVPSRRDRNGDHYQSIRVFGNHETGLNLLEQPKHLEELIHVAWAELLHTYLVKDTIYFAILPETRNGFRAGLGQDSADSTEGNYILACRSRFSGDENRIEYWSVSKEAFQSAHINTGIWTAHSKSSKPNDSTCRESVWEGSTFASSSQTIPVSLIHTVKILR